MQTDTTDHTSGTPSKGAIAAARERRVQSRPAAWVRGLVYRAMRRLLDRPGVEEWLYRHLRPFVRPVEDAVIARLTRERDQARLETDGYRARLGLGLGEF